MTMMMMINQSINQSASLAQVDIYSLHTANESVDDNDNADDQSKMHVGI